MLIIIIGRHFLLIQLELHEIVKYNFNCRLEMRGIEPRASRMQSERSTV
jgi:hypothetical protein